MRSGGRPYYYYYYYYYYYRGVGIRGSLSCRPHPLDPPLYVRTRFDLDFAIAYP